MPRVVVSLTSASLAMIAVACSNATDATVTRQLDAAVAATSSTIPFLPNTRVGVITALDNTIWVPTALNDVGEVVGWGNNGSGTTDQAFKWKADFGLIIRGTGAEEDTTSSIAVGVNNAGQVLLQGTSARVAIWDWYGNVRYLRALSSFNPNCTPYGITDVGVAAGVCIAGDNLLATAWTKSGTPDALFIGGGATPVVTANQLPDVVSDSGYIAGTLVDLSGFVFTPTKQLQVLPLPSYSPIKLDHIAASSVNNHGQVAGIAALASSACFVRPIAWLSPGQVTELGFCGQTAGITDDGMIFGTAKDTITGISTAVVWTSATGLHRLPGLEGGAAQNEEQSSVTAINHSRQALGTVITSTGVQHSVIWTLPAP